MNRTAAFLTSTHASAGPIGLTTLRVMEGMSMRPKTTSMVLGGVGILFGLQMLAPKEKDLSRRKKEPVLWDFFDPQGHHQIHWN